jgi:glutathione S-transferase
MNPFGRMPVLALDDGTYLPETVAICRYFEALHPEPPLFGVGAREQAEVEAWQRRMELEVFIPTSAYVRNCCPELKHVQPVQIPEYGEQCRERVLLGLHVADTQLARHEYLTGQRFTIADITLAVQLLAMPGTTGVKVPRDCRNLGRWLEEVYQRPSIKGTQPAATGLIQDVVARELR